MPISDECPVSEWTPEKLDCFATIVHIHVAISMRVLRKHQFYPREYRYIDATAGPGLVKELNRKGSPLLALDAISAAKCRARMDLIDVNPLAIVQLANEMLSRAHPGIVLKLHLGKYEEVSQELLRNKHDRNTIGLLYIDPPGTAVDADTVIDFAGEFPRMELLLCITATNMKRISRRPQEYLPAKNHWLIRKPVSHFHWTFMLGSNCNLFDKFRHLDMYPITSVEGREIFDKCNLTAEELARSVQPPLPFTGPTLNTSPIPATGQ